MASREPLAERSRVFDVEIGSYEWSFIDEETHFSTAVESFFGLPNGAGFDAFRATVPMQDWPAVEGAIESCRARLELAAHDHKPVRTSFVVEHRIVRTSGQESWVEERGLAIGDSTGQLLRIIGIVVDTTQRKNTETDLRLQAAAYSLFSELASDYIYRVDVDAPVRAPSIVAGAFERTTGYTHEEIAERGGWYTIVHPDDLAVLVPAWDQLLDGSTVHGEYRIIDSAGQVRWLRDNARPLRDPLTAKVVQVIGAVQDITELKRLEEALLQAQRLEGLAMLSGRVAHDFNNLLTVVLANVDIAEQSTDDKSDMLIEILGAIREAGLRGAELTRSLLALTRYQTGMAQVRDAREQLRAALPLLTPALGPGIKILLDLSDEPLRIRIDPSQMQLLLLNLAVNAGDAMPTGGQLTLRAYSLDPSTDTSQRPAELSPGPHVCIEVIDTGTGMDAETARRLFEPFFTTKSKGTGLGLTTCQRIMQAANGAIHVANTSSEGTTFALLFPQATGAIAKIQADRVHLSPGGTERILVVEDEPSVRSTAARALRGRGYKVFEAEDAQAALSLIEREHIDLIFSDVQLPGMSGRELADCVQARNLAAVLLTSGYLDDPSDLSAYSILPKPYTTSGLARRVREVLDAPHQREMRAIPVPS